MTIGQEEPDKFKKGQRLTAAALNGIVNSVVSIIKQMMGPRIMQPLNVQCLLTEDLFAAVSTRNDPSTAVARVFRRKANGDLRLTNRRITLVNRFMEISINEGTYVKAEWIDGEWQPYAADCAAGQSSSVSEGI